mmetsp:Transcript_17163/g.47039  ORF Transcript_17163/g.47039 Transcript_17163/m.47039 type:complete len:97 (+) Transcript_17163:37-327(+)
MESTGAKGRIQCSEATAECIRTARKEHWVVPRDDAVNAKGKGEMQTYWLDLSGSSASTHGGSVMFSSSSANINGVLDTPKEEAALRGMKTSRRRKH